MAYTPNVWIDRQGTGLNKFKDQNDNTYFFTAVPDTVLQAGTPVSAEWLNHMEQGIKENSDNIENFDSKFPVSIADGGTGATTSAAALSALGAAASGHKHSAADITSGTLPVARGGTGGTSAAAARQSLKVPYCVSDGDYYGLGLPDGTTDAYLRAPQLGILPYKRGGSGKLGTDVWPWDYIYGNAVYAPTLGRDLLYNGTLSSGSATLTNANNRYSHLIVGGYPGAGESLAFCAPPSYQLYGMQLTSNQGYITFDLTESGNNLIINKTGGSSGSYIWAVWGCVKYTA